MGPFCGCPPAPAHVGTDALRQRLLAAASDQQKTRKLDALPRYGVDPRVQCGGQRHDRLLASPPYGYAMMMTSSSSQTPNRVLIPQLTIRPAEGLRAAAIHEQASLVMNLGSSTQFRFGARVHRGGHGEPRQVHLRQRFDDQLGCPASSSAPGPASSS